MENVIEKTYLQSYQKANDKIYFIVGRKTKNQISYQIRNQIRNQVNNQLWWQVYTQVREQIFENVRDQILSHEKY
jgi:DNA-binding transcriptional regulator YhcF (GntR family)